METPPNGTPSTPRPGPQSESVTCDRAREDEVRAIEDVAFDMSIDESDARALFAARCTVIQKDHRDRDAVKMSVARSVAESESYLEVRDKALTEARTYGRPVNAEATRQELRADMARRISRYRPYIDELEQMHRRYRESAHRDGFESSVMAQYLLLSRAIALLRALLDSISHGHYYGLSLMRDIDECLDLAHYFLAAGDSERGKRNVRRWFREGQWPSHRECREAIAKHMADTVGLAAATHLANHAELYRKKSRFIHPSFLAIRDLTAFARNSKGDVIVRDVTYGTDAEEQRMWEGVEFFQASALLPVTQRLCMSLCASIGVETRDRDRLLALVQELGG